MSDASIVRMYLFNYPHAFYVEHVSAYLMMKVRKEILIKVFKGTFLLLPIFFLEANILQKRFVTNLDAPVVKQ